MSAFLNLLFAKLKPYYRVFVIIAVLVVISAVVYYAYNYVYLPKQKGAVFKNVANANPTNQAITIMIFHVDWCPHCKRALPEWNMFSTEYNGKQVNGYQFDCKEYDCTNTDDPKIAKLLETHKVKQYPTVIALIPSANGDMRVDFEAKVSKTNLEQFAISVATENTP